MNFSYTADIYWVSGITTVSGEMYGLNLASMNYSGNFAANVIPEPTTFILLGLGLAGTGIVRKLRR
ncbi:MAG: PEP-CTERM sorting domain-containing protein [Candidatus Zixiibacteriota bacterium]